MDKTAKASPRLILEVIGISSIILSLVFVAVELHQNTKAVHGQTNQAIADNVNALYLAIATDDENEYLVEDQAMAKKLKRLLRQVVHVSGVVKTEHGKNIIKIKQWRCQNE